MQAFVGIAKPRAARTDIIEEVSSCVAVRGSTGWVTCPNVHDSAFNCRTIANGLNQSASSARRRYSGYPVIDACARLTEVRHKSFDNRSLTVAAQ
jgi:hypothetical protein